MQVLPSENREPVPIPEYFLTANQLKPDLQNGLLHQWYIFQLRESDLFFP